MLKVFLIGICFSQMLLLSAQENGAVLKGKVVGVSIDGTEEPLIGANVYWQNSAIGTSTDLEGKFEIPFNPESRILIVSFIGFKSDTLNYEQGSDILVQLDEDYSLEEIEVVHRQKSTEVSYLNPFRVDKISKDELEKAACCNLSESFETTPSVDVSFTDAVTGTRQIQMLGLAGPYTQIMRESVPDVRGLSAVYGLTFVPGPWISGIQLNKGTGSVNQGFEGVAGQINVELEKPEDMDKLYLNAYANEGGRMEGNANIGIKLSDKVSTAFFLHASGNQTKHDRNNDGFLDMPLRSTFIGINRWKYMLKNGFRGQAGIKITNTKSTGGQSTFSRDQEINESNPWGMTFDTERYEVWTKFGWVNPDKSWQSIGFQFSALTHNQNSRFGLRPYDGRQNSLYGNLALRSNLGSPDHKYILGVSMIYDHYDEEVIDLDFKRNEIIPGAFFEYTYAMEDRFNLVAGIRADHHNQYGFFVTPRLHVRYAPNELTVFRISAGSGQRTANILAENYGYLASSRQFIVDQGEDPDNPYGLLQEKAWNFGASITREFMLDYRTGSLSVDYYYTNFVNQVIVDVDSDPQQVSFYNLDGSSFAHAIQVQFDYELLKFLDLRIAYRLFDVKSTYGGELLEKPLVSKHRAFANLAYKTRSNWKFDVTVNWQGQKRLPSAGSNPDPYRWDERSPSFTMVNAQITKVWKERFEIYVGGENLLDFTQKDPIISSDDPFGKYFDSTVVWAPIFGRNIYLGLRYRVF